MPVMIKLQLNLPSPTFDAVRQLPGLQDLELDRKFGLVGIDPKKGLFVVRTAAMNDLEGRKHKSPEILGAYGEVRISTS